MLLFHTLKFCIIKRCLNLERELTSNTTINSTTFLKCYLVSVLPRKDNLPTVSVAPVHSFPPLLSLLYCESLSAYDSVNQTRSGEKKNICLKSPENKHT